MFLFYASDVHGSTSTLPTSPAVVTLLLIVADGCLRPVALGLEPEHDESSAVHDVGTQPPDDGENEDEDEDERATMDIEMDSVTPRMIDEGGTPTTTTADEGGTSTTTTADEGGTSTTTTVGEKLPLMPVADAIWIAGGSFVDGTVIGVNHDIAAFWLGRTEVTLGQYRACVAEGECVAPRSDSIYAAAPTFNFGAEGRDDHPINGVSMPEAIDYCEWVGGRLPTEWEWEWAARGRESGNTYPWTSQVLPSCDVAFMNDAAIGSGCGLGTTGPVGTKSPAGDSRDGVQDLGGNVWEWAVIGVPEDVSNGIGILRGGSWAGSSENNFRVNFRRTSGQLGRTHSSGFRCAWDAN